MSIHFSLQSEFALPARTNAMRLTTDEGVDIEVQSSCIGQAKRVCHDLQTIANASAHPVPTLQVAIMREIQCANYEGLPLACHLRMDVL